MGILRAIILILRTFLKGQNQLILENLALRQQILVLQRTLKRPRLHRKDRIFWVLLARFWRDWRRHIFIVKPETVVRWHRQGFKYFWRWKSYVGRKGRPAVPLEIIHLIRRMSRENLLWGAPRIQSELRLLGYDVAESTVSKYMKRQDRRPPSQTWRTFLRNHMCQTAACDFFLIFTINFRLMFCFIVLSHDRRRIVHFNVTPYPTSEWTAQQVIEAFPGDGAVPKYLVRDRDTTYGAYFRQRVRGMSIREVIIGRKSPWQNPYAERVIGSIRRECLDHVIPLSELHLRRILKEYLRYYNNSRTHLSLQRNSPIPREIEPQGRGPIIAVPLVGGLHHRYKRAA